jgi:GDPmannose 4,6-dehydratase
MPLMVESSASANVYFPATGVRVASSWRQPLLTANVTGVGVTNVLEAIRLGAPKARFYQASSSEMYGLIQEPMQSEKTPLSAQPLRRRQALRPLDHGELPRKLRLT